MRGSAEWHPRNGYNPSEPGNAGLDVVALVHRAPVSFSQKAPPPTSTYTLPLEYFSMGPAALPGDSGSGIFLQCATQLPPAALGIASTLPTLSVPASSTPTRTVKWCACPAGSFSTSCAPSTRKRGASMSLSYHGTGSEQRRTYFVGGVSFRRFDAATASEVSSAIASRTLGRDSTRSA